MKFEKISVGRSIVDFLTEAEVFNVTTNVVLTEAEKFGGYIAGGFAFEFLKLLMGHGSIDAIPAKMLAQLRSSYLGLGLDLRVFTAEKPSTSMFGDIDIWFPDAESHSKFLISMREAVHRWDRSIYEHPSVGGFATNIICFSGTGVDGQKIQAISKYGGDIEHVLQMFDIVNAACALRGSEITVCDRVSALFAASEVAVNPRAFSFDSAGVGRLSKWMSRHSVVKLSVDAVERLNADIDEYVDSVVSDHKNGFKSRSMSAYTAEVFENYVPKYKTSAMLGTFVRYLTIDSLLKLSLIYNHSNNDNPAMNEIMKRNAAIVDMSDGAR